MAVPNLTGRTVVDVARQSHLTDVATRLFLADNAVKDENVSDYLDKNKDELKKYLNRINNTTTMSQMVREWGSNGAPMVRYIAKKLFEPRNVSPQFISIFENQAAPIANHLLQLIEQGTTPIVHSGQQLIESAIRMDNQIRYASTKSFGVHASMAEQERALKNIHRTGKFVEFDLEGANGYLHEFALTNFDRTIKNAAHADVGSIANGIIGMNDKEYTEAMSLINAYRDGGIYKEVTGRNRGIHESQRYILESYAKFGHDKTTWETLADGTVRLTGYAADEDVKNLNIQDMVRGVERYHKIWQEQTASKVSYAGHDMYAHEAAMLKKLQHIKDSGLTIVTQNGMGYDVGMWDSFFNGSQASSGARAVFRSMTGTGSISSIAPHLDVVTVNRELNVVGRSKADRDAYREIAKAGVAWNSSEANMIRFAGGKNHVMSIVKETLGEGNFVQHAAVPDNIAQGVEVWGMLDTIYNKDSDNYVFKNINKLTEHIASRGDIFYVRKGMFANNGYGNLSFTQDALTGELRFAGGVKVSADGKASPELVRQGLKSNSLAMLADIRKISVKDLPSEMLAQLGPDAGQKELVATYWMSYGGKGTARSRNMQVHVTTLEKTQEFLNNQYFAGHISPDKIKEKVDMSGWTSTQILQEMASGKHNGLVNTDKVDFYTKKALTLDGSDEYDFEKLANLTEKHLANDSAANWIRELNYAKWDKVEKYLKLVEDRARKNTNSVDLTTADIRKAAEELANEAMISGDKKLQKKFRNIFTTQLFSGENLYMSNTVDNATKSVGYTWNMRQIYGLAKQAADKFGSSQNEKNLYFTSYFDHLLASISQDVGGDFMSASGRDTKLPLLGFQRDYFRVDISTLLTDYKVVSRGTINSNLDNYIDIPLYEKSPHWGKELVRKLQISGDQEVVALRKLATLINRQYGLKEHKIRTSDVYQEDVTMDSIARGLRKLRNLDPNIGAIHDISLQDLSREYADVERFYKKYANDQEGMDKVLGSVDDAQKIVGEFHDYKEFNSKNFARLYTQRLFKESSSITKDDLLKYGYGEATIESMLTERDRRMKETQILLTSVFEKAIEKNPYIRPAYDPVSGTLKISAGVSNTEIDLTKYMVFDRFDANTGSFYSQLGGRRIATRTLLSPNGWGLDVHSWVNEYANSIADRIGFVNGPNVSAQESLRRLDWVLSSSADNISNLGVTRYDLQDVHAGRKIDLSAFFKRLGYLNSTGAYDEYGFTGELRDTLNALTEKMYQQGYGREHIEVTPTIRQLGVLYGNFDALIAPLARPDSTASYHLFFGDMKAWREFSKILPHLNISGEKDPSKMLASLDTDSLSALGGISKDNRGIETLRTLEFDYEERAAVNSKIRDIMRPGRILMNNTEAVAYDGLSPIRNRGGRITQLSMNTATVKEIIEAGIKDMLSQNEYGITSRDELKSLDTLYSYLNEGGGMMNPTLLDIMPKSIIQKQATKDLILFQELHDILGKTMAENEIKIREATNEVIKIAQNGVVQFKYGGEELVKVGQNIDWTKTWVGTADNIRAAREGFVYRRFMKNGLVVSEDEIRKVLQDNAGELSGEGAVLQQRAADVLAREGYTEKYILESIDALESRKFKINDEKSTLRAPTAYLGEFDEYVKEVIGADGSGNQERLRLDIETIRNKDRLAKVLGEHGYKFNASAYDEAKFLERALKERNFYFDMMLKGAGELAGGEDFSKVAVIGNTFSEAIKDPHMELSGNIAAKLNTAIEYMVRDGMNYKEARDNLYKEFVKNDIFTRDGENILEAAGDDAFRLGKLTQFKVDKLENILDEYLFTYGDDGKKKLKYFYLDGKMVLNSADIAAVYDANEAGLNRGGNKKGILATRRMIENLGQEIYGDASLNKVWESYKDTYADAEDRFNRVYDGIAQVAKGKDGEYSIKFEEGMSGSKVNQALIENLNREIVAGDMSARYVTNRNYKSVAKELGIDADDVKRLMEGMQAQGYVDIGQDFIMHAHAAQMSHAASKINAALRSTASTGEQEGIIEEYENKGFKLFNLNEVANQPTQANEGNPYRVNRSMIVDLGEKVENITGSRYIALPYQSFSVMNARDNLGIESHSELIKALNSLHNRVEKIGTVGERVTEFDYREIQNSVDKMFSLVNQYSTAKTGEMASATSSYLYGSGMFKAAIFNSADASNPLLKQAMYDGSTIADLIGERRVNAIFVGTDFFQNALGGSEFKVVLDAIGKGDEEKSIISEMMRTAEEKGVEGIGLRQPMEYMNSVASGRVYLARNLASNQMLITDSMAAGMHADMDGDLAYSYLVRANAQIYKDGELLTTARLNKLQIDTIGNFEGLTVKYDDSVFKGMRQASDLLANAAYSGANVDRGDEEIIAGITKKYGEKGYVVDGSVYNFANMEVGKRTALDNQYSKIIGSEEFQSAMRAEGVESLDDIDTNKLAKISNSYLEGMAKGSAERESAAEALARGIYNMEMRSEIDAKLARNEAGLINMSTYRFKGIVNMLEEARNRSPEGMQTLINDKDAEIIGAMIEHLNEAGQAGKNAKQSWTAEGLNEAMSSFFGVYNGRSDTSKLFDIIDQEFEAGGGKIKELEKLPEYASIHGSAENIKAAFSRILPEGTVINRGVWDAFRTGYTKSEFTTDVKVANHNDLARAVQNVTQDILKDRGIDIAEMRDANILVKASRGPILNGSMEEALNPVDMEDIEPTLSEHIGGAFKGLKKAFSGHGAMAMLGFAGVTMMAGVMGGAPTAPPSAQGQAKGIQSDNAMYEIPSTMGTPGKAGSANQSYIININASTDKGRDFAETALKQAFSAMPRKEQGINMTMNIKDSSSNIGYSDIASQLTDML